MLAAQGELAPRAHEQLAILVLLLDDADPEIRLVADETLNKIPIETLQAFLARSDVPIDLREFFGDRGVFPAEIPALDFEGPLIDTGAPEFDMPDDAEEGRESVQQRVTNMGFVERLKAAVKGTKEMRSILIRDPNKMISTAVLSSPKVTDQEAAGFARMASLSEDVIRAIGHNRAWLKNYGVVLALTRNPKTPVAMSLNLMSRLQNSDLAKLAVDRNIPEALRLAARKKVQSGGKE
jgi:hypothetical protein